MRPRTTFAKFWSLFIEEPMTGCWIWLGSRFESGYGRIGVNRRGIRAHRWAYENLRGPIPSNLEIDHVCRQKLCVNPAHLELVTDQEQARRRNAVITHCPQGHPLVAGNLTPTSVKRGHRTCLICQREANRNNMRARRARAKESV